MLLNCVKFIISMGIGNFRKLSLSLEVKQNLFCTLSVDFGFCEFRSFWSNSMAKVNLTNIARSYLLKSFITLVPGLASKGS
jgi:hypothetical protein